MKFNDDYLLIFKYKDIPNCLIKNNGSIVSNDNVNGKYCPMNRSRFDSIGDVQESNFK